MEEGNSETMSLVCILYFWAAHHINVVITHIAGSNNSIADSLFCFRNQRFQELAPHTQPLQDNVPAWPTPSFIQPFNSLFSSTYTAHSKY